MNLQVDLLKKTERRFQGIVSMKVMVLGSVGVLVGTLVLVLSLAGISRMTLQANLLRVRREWERIEPVVKVVRGDAASTEANWKVRDRLNAWSKGGSTPMYQVLRETQREIPERMQLNNLFVGIQESEDGDDFYLLRLSGRVLGELVAVEGKRKLNSNADITGFCGDLRLISSAREAGDVWAFALEGRRAAGGAK